MKGFEIASGVFIVPGKGRVDTRFGMTDEEAFDLYQLGKKKFPFVQLLPEAVEFLKNQKLKVAELIVLIRQATTAKEVEILAQINEKSASLKTEVENKLLSFL